MASGSSALVGGYASTSIPSAAQIGGIDVYRGSTDDPVALNKDWYAVLRNADAGAFLVEGPIRDREHWLDDLPERLRGIEVIGLVEKPNG